MLRYSGIWEFKKPHEVQLKRKVPHSFIHVLLCEMNMAPCPEVHALLEHGAMTEVVPRTVSGEVGSWSRRVLGSAVHW
jgi:hypothetical protein